MNAANRRDGQPPPQSSPKGAGGGLSTAFTIDSLYNLRAEVAAHALHLGLAEPQLSNMLVVATELATNVVRHGGGAGRLRLWRDGDSIFCEVSDDGPGIALPHAAGLRPVPLAYDGGRGLWLVRHFTDTLEIVNRELGATVTVSMQIR
ncbi:MAG TPA: ATP-binding protein [Candidatus Limnocylindrales bacterium]